MAFDIRTGVGVTPENRSTFRRVLFSLLCDTHTTLLDGCCETTTPHMNLTRIPQRLASHLTESRREGGGGNRSAIEIRAGFKTNLRFIVILPAVFFLLITLIMSSGSLSQKIFFFKRTLRVKTRITSVLSTSDSMIPTNDDDSPACPWLRKALTSSAATYLRTFYFVSIHGYDNGIPRPVCLCRSQKISLLNDLL